MWTRKELKETAKIRFKANYWKAVLVALILTIVSNGGNFSSRNNYNSNVVSDVKVEQNQDNDEVPSIGFNFVDPETEENFDFNLPQPDETETQAMYIALGIAIAAIVVIIFAIAFAVSAFLLSPIEVGCRSFFNKNLKENASLKELGVGFNKNYLNVVKVSFFEALYIMLWSLLFVIPGIVKAYQYRMVSYILAENPDINVNDALEQSKQMMDGHKWNTFVLDLSFIGWHLLSVLTLGLLSIFYVLPYQFQTEAALYAKLSGNDICFEDTVSDECYVEVE